MSLDAAVVGEWECMECGCIQAGVAGRRPESCPDCGAPSQALEFFPDEVAAAGTGDVSVA